MHLDTRLFFLFPKSPEAVMTVGYQDAGGDGQGKVLLDYHRGEERKEEVRPKVMIKQVVAVIGDHSVKIITSGILISFLSLLSAGNGMMRLIILLKMMLKDSMLAQPRLGSSEKMTFSTLTKVVTRTVKILYRHDTRWRKEIQHYGDPVRKFIKLIDIEDTSLLDDIKTVQ